MQKGFVQFIVLGVVVLAAVAAGAFYLGRSTTPKPSPAPVTNIPQPTSTTDETANWETYTNTQHGFTMKYPSVYSTAFEGPNYSQKQLDSGEQISGTVAPSFDTIDFQGGDPKFSIGIFHKRDDIAAAFDGSCGTQFADKTIVNAKITTPFEYINLEQQSGNTINIQHCFLSGTKNLLVIGIYEIKPDSTDKNRQFLNQILSTFKFLDQNDVEGKFCGGIAANLPENQCPTGYKCQLDGGYPDAGGKCVKL